MVRRGLLLMTVVGLTAAGCASDVSFRPPAGMTQMWESASSDELVQRFYPGMKGVFFGSSAQTPDAPVFGVVHRPGQPGKVFLAGASQKRSWAEDLGTEPATMRLEELVPIAFYVGDLQKDGTAELLLVLRSKAVDPETGCSSTRTALYLYELARSIRLIWYHTLRFKGEADDACQKGYMQYEAVPSYNLTADGNLESITIDYDRVSDLCSGGEGCQQMEGCIKGHDSGKTRFVWDPEMRLFRQESSSESRLQIPDVRL